MKLDIKGHKGAHGLRSNLLSFINFMRLNGEFYVAN